jgi:hypothetical protein
MKNRKKLLSTLGTLLISVFILVACDSVVKPDKPTIDEVKKIMTEESDYPKGLSIEVPAIVHERDWFVAYNKTGFLRKLVEAGLMKFGEPSVKDPVYRLSPTEEGAKYLLKNGEVQPGGDFQKGFYLARQATQNYGKLNEVAEMVSFKGPPPSVEMLVTDIHFDINLSDVTPYGKALGLEDGQVIKEKTGLLWRKGKWNYISK